MNEKFFIAIGPQKTGTTWMYEVLKKHPQVELPRYKEVGYFYEKAFLGKPGVAKNLFSKVWFYKKKRKYLFNSLQKHLKKLVRFKLNWPEFKWDLKFLLSPPNDRWYLNLFNKQKVCGDISPNYVELPESEIEAISKLIPDAKIIISLRDPIERQWSRVRMKVRVRSKNKMAKTSEKEELDYLIKSKRHNKTFDYVELVQKWTKYFPKENIFIFFYEELQDDPVRLFNSICKFLKIDLIDIGEVAKEKVNKGMLLELPAEYISYLIESNLNYLEKMPDFFEKKYPAEWLKKYKSYLSNNNAAEQLAIAHTPKGSNE